MKMNQLLRWIVLLIVVCGMLGCSKKSNETAGKSSSQTKTSGGTEARQVDKTGPAVITLTPANAKVKVGETLTVTGILSHVPKDQNRWLVSVGWDSSDGQHSAQALKEKDGKYLNTCDFAWKEAGEYEVKITYYGNGNKAFAEQTTKVMVE